MPLINILCSFRDSPFWTDPFLFYAGVREIVAHAGYYSVTMRRSAGIFHVLSATPGARMDWPIESQASYDLYRATKEEAERRDAAWAKAEKARMKEAETAGGGGGGLSAKELEDMKKAYNLESYHRLRGAKVKYAVWPMIKRYKAENVGKPVIRPDDRRPHEYDSAGNLVRRRNRSSGSGGPGDPSGAEEAAPDDVEQGEGQRIVDIGRCIVIYYQGLIYPPKAPASPPPGGRHVVVDGLPLLAHVAARGEAERRARHLRHRWARFWLGFAVSLALYLSYDTPFWARLGEALPVLADAAYEHLKHVSVYRWAVAALVAMALFRDLRHFLVGGAFISGFVFVVGYVCIQAYMAVSGYLITDPLFEVLDHDAMLE